MMIRIREYMTFICICFFVFDKIYSILTVFDHKRRLYQHGCSFLLSIIKISFLHCLVESSLRMFSSRTPDAVHRHGSLLCCFDCGFDVLSCIYQFNQFLPPEVSTLVSKGHHGQCICCVTQHKP